MAGPTGHHTGMAMPSPSRIPDSCGQLPRLDSMPPSACVPFEADWLVWGPFDEPGPIQRHPTPLDGMAALPAGPRPPPVRSLDGCMDFAALLGRSSGFPSAVAATWIDGCPGDRLQLQFGADWSSVWWLGGELICDRRSGNECSPDLVHGNGFDVPLHGARTLLVVRVGAGSIGWRLQLRRPRSPVPAVSWELPSAARGRPTRDYRQSGLRIEHRVYSEVPGAERWADEDRWAEQGVAAHWLQISDDDGHEYSGSPLYPSRVFDQSPGSRGVDGLARLRSWVTAMHDAGLTAMTWHTLSCSGESLRRRPEWRVAPLEGQPASNHGCINTGYGEAVGDFLDEAIGVIGLDGVWLDWARVSGRTVGCRCAACTRLFRADTGMDMPQRIDWTDSAFRHWVVWRERMFAAYWARLAGRLRRRHPHAVLAINQQNRGTGSWTTGCPLAPLGLDIVGGTETAVMEGASSFMAKLTCAFRHRQAEVWTHLKGYFADPSRNPLPFAYHALATLTAGAVPSYGCDPRPADTTGLMPLLAHLIAPRLAWTGGRPVGYAGLHIGGRTDTFHAARLQADAPGARPWTSYQGWEGLLRQHQLPCDILFDDDLSAERLEHLHVLLIPASACLADAQVRAILAFAAGGGLVVTTPLSGICDEWGQPAGPARIAGQDGAGPAEWCCHAVGRGRILHFGSDPGPAFHSRAHPELARCVADLIAGSARPWIRVVADCCPTDLNLAVHERAGSLILHVHHLPGPSTAVTAFPHPLRLPPPQRDETVLGMRGWPLRTARSVLPGRDGCVRLFGNGGGETAIAIARLGWGDVLELSY